MQKWRFIACILFLCFSLYYTHVAMSYKKYGCSLKLFLQLHLQVICWDDFFFPSFFSFFTKYMRPDGQNVWTTNFWNKWLDLFWNPFQLHNMTKTEQFHCSSACSFKLSCWNVNLLSFKYCAAADKFCTGILLYLIPSTSPSTLTSTFFHIRSSNCLQPLCFA